jgi:hypothetical protein
MFRRVLVVAFLSACQNRPGPAGAEVPPHSERAAEPAAKGSAAAPPLAAPDTPTNAPLAEPDTATDTPHASPGSSTSTGASPRPGPVTEAVVQRRLDDYAATLPKNAVVPRIALADVAYPRTQAELNAMGGFAAVLVTAICRDAAELPIAQVEFNMPNDRLKLPLVVSQRTEFTSASKSTVYGKARFDAVFLLPVFLTRKEGTVIVYLGAGARPLRVLSFPSAPGEDGLRPGLHFDWAPTQPETPVLHKLIDEELPVLAGLKFVGEEKR